MALVAMFLAAIATLLALGDPADARESRDAPTVIVDEPVTPIAPASEALVPARPAPPAPQVPDAPAPPSPPLAAPPPAASLPPAPAETVGEARPAPPPVRPSAGLGLEIGYARGGDRLFTLLRPVALTPGGSDTTAHAGDGLFFSLSASWMPFWSEGGVGLGVYARAGVKYTQVEDDATKVVFVRVPLAAGAQLLLPVTGRWFALARLGVMTEVLEQVSFTSAGSSHGSTDFSSALGQFLDAGGYWAATEHAGFALIARYERLDVVYGGQPVSANNIGALAGAFFRF